MPLSFFNRFGAAKTWVARYVGISGLGTNPTNPWCQHPGRPPLHSETEPSSARSDGNELRTGPETNTEESGIAVWQRCFICGLAMTGDGGGEQEM